MDRSADGGGGCCFGQYRITPTQATTGGAPPLAVVVVVVAAVPVDAVAFGFNNEGSELVVVVLVWAVTVVGVF